MTSSVVAKGIEAGGHTRPPMPLDLCNASQSAHRESEEQPEGPGLAIDVLPTRTS
jgi:hypothetical protein